MQDGKRGGEGWRTIRSREDKQDCILRISRWSDEEKLEIGKGGKSRNMQLNGFD